MLDQNFALILLAHPYLEYSRVNAHLLKKISDLEFCTIRRLYDLYPDHFIDTKVEQDLLKSHQLIVFQHPFYWYSCPSLLKEWIDCVLQKGFAYGPNGRYLQGKKLLSVISTGGSQDAYAESGYNRYPVAQFLLPFEQTAVLCGMEYLNPIVFNGTFQLNTEQIETFAENYRTQLITLFENHKMPTDRNTGVLREHS